LRREALSEECGVGHEKNSREITEAGLPNKVSEGRYERRPDT
jgi:hypothetical protein